MNVGRAMLKGGFLLGGGQVANQACAFLRNVIIARLLSPADFGIASLFALTLSLLEMISNVASEKLLVQADDGDEVAFQGTAHLLLVGRGIISAVLILCCSNPLSRLFGAPNAQWAFACLSLVPLIRGVMHLDMHRVQRSSQFGSIVTVDVASNVLSLFAAIPLLAWRRDYGVVLWLTVGQSAIGVVASHWVAERRYTWCWSGGYARRIMAFGWPLLVNGLLLFGIFQGDRFIIGSANRLFHKEIYSLAQLGVFSVAFGLTLTPTLVLANVASALLLPAFSRAKNDPTAFQRVYSTSAETIALVSGVIALPMLTCGGFLVTTIYGGAYSSASHVIAWLAAMQAVRIIRITPTVAAISKGDTKNAMVSNFYRSLAFIGSLIVAHERGSLASIGAMAFFGELMALSASVYRLRKLQSVPVHLCLHPSVLTIGTLSLVAVFVEKLPSNQSILSVCLCAALTVLLYKAFTSFFPAVRQLVHFVVLRASMQVLRITTRLRPLVRALSLWRAWF